jgi:hypothetical protein
MMRDHLYPRLAAGMAAGLLIQAAPPAWAARTAAAGGPVAAGQPETSARLVEIRAAATCTWSAMAAAARRYRRTDTRSGNVTIKQSLNTQPGRTGPGSRAGA